MIKKTEITVADQSVRVVEYQGQRVVTLGMIDQVHSRPEGTARRNFNENRTRFIEGEDFVKVTANEFRTRNPGAISNKATENVMAPGTPTKSTKAKEFVAALAQVREKKQKST